MALLCQAKEGLGAGCTYSARYYEEKGQFHTSPQAGDQIFFTNRTAARPCTTPASW